VVTLVLSDGSGTVLGELPPLAAADSPYWPEVDEVVASVRQRWGLEVVVLRLLTTEEPYAGGAVSYLAQLVAGSPPPAVLAPVSREREAACASDPAYRLWWARPGGLDDLTAWVDLALLPHGRRRTGPLRQRRTWNLSVVVTAAMRRRPRLSPCSAAASSSKPCHAAPIVRTVSASRSPTAVGTRLPGWRGSIPVSCRRCSPTTRLDGPC